MMPHVWNDYFSKPSNDAHISWTCEGDVFRDASLQTGKIMPNKLKEKRMRDEDRQRKRERWKNSDENLLAKDKEQERKNDRYMEKKIMKNLRIGCFLYFLL